MADKRKLQGEIDRCLKKVSEGVETFEDVWQKVHNASNANQKDKYEADLKKEIKKLQRLRDQIKTWIASNDIKDKRQLLENRKLIETQMERFKVVERETKTKAYSKEGLGLATKLDPREKEKNEILDFLSNAIDTLSVQVEGMEGEIETIAVPTKRGKKDKDKAEKIEQLRFRLEKHRFHIKNLEKLMRLLDNETVTVCDVKKIKEDIEFYVDSSLEDDFEENDYIYDELNMDELQPAFLINATVESNGNTPGNHASKNSPKEGKSERSPTKQISLDEPLTPSMKSNNVLNLQQLTSESCTLTTTMSAMVENSSDVCNITASTTALTNGGQSHTASSSTNVSPAPSPGLSSPHSKSTVVNNSTPQINNDLSSAFAFAAASSTPSTPAAKSVWSGKVPIAAKTPPATNTVVSLASSSAKVLSARNEASNDTRSQTIGGETSASNSPAPQLQPQPIQTSSAAVTSQNFGSSNPRLSTESPTGTSVWGESNDKHFALNGVSSQQSNHGMINGLSTDSTTDKEMLKSLTKNIGSMSLANNGPSLSNLQGDSLGHLDPKMYAKANLLMHQNQPTNNKEEMKSNMPVSLSPNMMMNSASVESNNFSSMKSNNNISRMDMQTNVATRDNESLHSSAYNKSASLEITKQNLAWQRKQLMQKNLLEAAFKKKILPIDSCHMKGLVAQYPSGAAYLPPVLDASQTQKMENLSLYMDKDEDYIFFLFYYLEGSPTQLLAAKLLKQKSWRFHTKYRLWFQRLDQPQHLHDDYESGTYIYWDTDSWKPLERANFIFEYKYLEDKEF